MGKQIVAKRAHEEGEKGRADKRRVREMRNPEREPSHFRGKRERRGINIGEERKELIFEEADLL